MVDIKDIPVGDYAALEAYAFGLLQIVEQQQMEILSLLSQIANLESQVFGGSTK